MRFAPRRGGLVDHLRVVPLDYRYVWGVHLRSLAGGSVPARYRQGDRAPVLLLPGVYQSWRTLRWFGDRLSERGHPVVVVPGLAHNRQPILATAELAQRVLDANDLRDVVVLAHSKGGIVAKTMMVETDSEHRITRLVAVNSPFSGSRWARRIGAPALRAFSPVDADLVRLGETTSANERITSLASRFDPHVPEGSVLPGARNVELPVDGHFRPLGDAASRALVLAAVEG